MTDPLLVLAWLVLAHLTSDFLLQTGAIAAAKSASGRPALGGLLAHGLIVAACLIPVGLAYGGPGWTFLVLTAVTHAAIDRAKVLLTRRAAAAALAEAHRRHEGPQPSDHLGRAWTPRPAALFLLDQAAHLAVAAILWAILLVPSSLVAGWTSAIDGWLGTWDRAVVHDVVSAAVVLASLAIVNVLAAALFVAILVRPVEQSAGETRWGGRVAPATNPLPPAGGSGAPATGPPLVAPDRAARRADRGRAGPRARRRRRPRPIPARPSPGRSGPAPGWVRRSASSSASSSSSSS